MIILVLVVLGLVLGSFVNALVWRLHEQSKAKDKGQRVKSPSILKGRSMCPYCRHELAALDLVPVASWLWLKGKCRYCRKPISAQYPLVELATAGLFVSSYIYWPMALRGVGMFELILWLVFLTGFIALAVYDLRWFLLPDKIIYPLIGLAIAQIVIVSIWNGSTSLLPGALWGVLVLAGGFYLLFQLSAGKWIGGGDVKLGGLLGLVGGGPLAAVLLLFFASAAGSLYALPVVMTQKTWRKAKVPFGPFLLLAAVLVQLFGAHIIHWYKGLYF